MIIIYRNAVLGAENRLRPRINASDLREMKKEVRKGQEAECGRRWILELEEKLAHIYTMNSLHSHCSRFLTCPTFPNRLPFY